MKVILFGAILVFLLVSCLGDCEIKGHSFKDGDTYDPIGQECLIYTCLENGDITAKGCPAFVPPKDSKPVPEDLTKPFPDCCESYTLS